ncbi:eCIS core domain-containing protein [Halogeometricum rufum]|uniref:eCIS core domain-containing protein n=1 Tax=Halogeometricum rufum TaxID=553469 RepID=UPI000B7D9327|nr:DUF4157 domain-containing protein [Halogeometricum rufum]
MSSKTTENDSKSAESAKSTRSTGRSERGEGSSTASHPLVDAQRRYGNRAVRRVVGGGEQRRSDGSPSEARDERAAERTARRVVTTPERSPDGVGTDAGHGSTETTDAGETDARESDSGLSTEGESGAAVVRRASDAPATGSGEGLSPRGTASGGGEPIPPSVRAFFEPRFGRDFGHVRLHTGGRAAAASEALDARAFTYGSDIYFGANQYDSETSSGRELIAHELAHVEQQSNGGVPEVRRQSESDAGPEDEDAGQTLGDVEQSQLTSRGIQLDAAQESTLAATFPNGFMLGEERPVYVLGIGNTGTQSLRLPAIRIQQPPPLRAGVEVILFKVDKGRSILLRSVGGTGPDVVLDAGTGTDITGRSDDVRRLTETFRRASARGMIGNFVNFRVSHIDTDHFNAIESFLRASQLQRATIEITTQQLRQVSHAGWSSLEMSLRTGQEIVEIDVLGAGRRLGPSGGQVHERRAVVGNMEITEYRSVEAHRQLTETDRRTFDKNRTSPVTIVKDLVTGDRWLFGADARQRQFSESVDAVGQAALSRLLGAGGFHLRGVEQEHHGGAITTGPDVKGMIRKLRLTFEASDGTTRFFTQTSESFASGASASIRFLDLAGVNVERVTTDPSPEGRSEVIRGRGRTMETVQFDARSFTRVTEFVRTHEGELMRAAATRHETVMLRQRAEALHEAYSQGGAPARLRSSAEQIKQGLEVVERQTWARVDALFSAMESAAEGRQGMRAGRDMSIVTSALAAIRRHVESARLETFRRDIEIHENSLNAYGRAFQTMFSMFRAVQTEQWREVNRLRGVYESRLAEARAVLGQAEVHEHVRSAWKATRSHWTGEQIQRVAAQLGRATFAHRLMMSEFRVELLQSLGRQMRLNEMMSQAMHGGITGGRVSAPMRSRVGAGALAALEVIRIGVELAETAHQASIAKEAAEERARATGARTAMWWIRQGVRPTLALVKRGFWGGYDVVSGALTQEQILRVASGESIEATVPEYEKVVVTGVDSAELERVVYSQYLQSQTLEDWTRFNAGYPSDEAFKKFGDDWGVRLWDREEGEYRYVYDSAIQRPLNELHAHLERAQQARFERDVETSEEGSVRTVEDTGIVQDLRRVYVFSSGGSLRKLDFDDVEPRFLRVGTQTVRGKQYALVRAVDMRTFRRLSRYYWREYSHSVIGQHYSGPVYDVYRNAEGYALVHEDELTLTAGSRRFESEIRSRAGQSE